MTAIKPVPEIPLEEEELGPAMRALPPRMRAFVFHYVNNGGKASRAIVSAGYSDSSPNVVNVKASQLVSDDRVQKAIQEHSWKMLSSLTPMALSAYETILSTPMHKDYARIASEVLDRTGFRLPTVHHIKVEKEPSKAELLAEFRATCAEMKIDPETIIAGIMGRKRLPLPGVPEPEISDAEVVPVELVRAPSGHLMPEGFVPRKRVLVPPGAPEPSGPAPRPYRFGPSKPYGPRKRVPEISDAEHSSRGLEDIL